jgi:lactate dehydrogenase-like 2-hydroxyacid dehydrogenase
VAGAAYRLTPATLRDRTVGLVGMGAIGQAIARRLDAFKVPVVYHSRKPREGVPYATIPTCSRWRATSTSCLTIVPGGPGTRT